MPDPEITLGHARGGAQASIGNLIETRYKPLAMLLANYPVPVLAAVNGVAAGAGANLGLTCATSSSPRARQRSSRHSRNCD